MTKKHFIALAAEIALIDDREARRKAADAVARAARQFNPNFDKARFLAACFPGSTPEG